MIRIHVSVDGADDCDTAALAGIVRDALQADTRFIAHADFRGISTMIIVSPSERGFNVDAYPVDRCDQRWVAP